MKILHVIPSYKPAYIYGGPIESVARLCEGLVQAGHYVDVATTTANGRKELDVVTDKPLDIDGVKVTYFKRITTDPTHISPSLWKYLYQNCHKYDVIHIHSWWNILVIGAAIICHLRKAKVLISPRGMLSHYVMTNKNGFAKKVIHKLVGKMALSRAHFHATAQSEYEECINLIRGWKGILLPNILTLPNLKIEKSDNDLFTLIFLSRIHPKKGLELLFEAISKFPFSILLKIAGTGDEEYISELKVKAAELNISNKIEWIGWRNRDEKFQELMKADAFVLTSFNENFANVVIESLHMGTPVIISEHVGLASFVEENNLGWVTSLNVETIKQKISDAFHDNQRKKIINEIGRRKIEEFFSEDVLISKYAKSYQSL